MKKVLCMILAMLFAVPLVGCGEKMPTEINVLTWKDYLPVSVADEFTVETGIKVNMKTANTNEEMLEELRKKDGTYDMVILSDYASDTAIKEGLLQKTDFSKMENMKYVNPGFQSKYYDKNNEYTLPYSAAGILIAYDPAKTPIVIDSYSDLTASELLNSIAFLDDESAILGITNIILGKDPANTVGLGENQKLLGKLNRNAMQTGGRYLEDLLISGDASVGVMFTSNLGFATAYNKKLEIVYPNEGFLCSIDVMAVPVNAKGAKGARMLMNYIHDPMVNGKIIPEISCSTVNLSAEQFMDAEYRDSDGYNIDSDKAEKGILMTEVPEEKMKPFRWTYNRYFMIKDEPTEQEAE